MKWLKNRSEELEIMDRDGITQTELFELFRELKAINNLLGGHKATLYGLNRLYKLGHWPKDRTVGIVDMGCGGGDNLLIIAQWARSKGISVRLYGIDIAAPAIEFAKEACLAYQEISFIHDDFRQTTKHIPNYDIAINSLFCHHLYNKDLSDALQTMKKAKLGFIINDLHRHWLAYYSIKWLTALFSKSRLVRNDACLSVWRGFKREDWAKILFDNGIAAMEIKWCWAFRWCVCGVAGDGKQ